MPSKPLALLVLLENVGHIHGLTLPSWVRATIDFVSEAYAKFILLLYGAHRAYDRVVVLEDARANGAELREALLRLSETHRVDLLLLVHGVDKGLVGYRGHIIGEETFARLRQAVRARPDSVDLRVVFGINCHGASLVPLWRELGAKAVSGAAGVNWFPEPLLSSFLLTWLRGRTFEESVARANRAVSKLKPFLKRYPESFTSSFQWVTGETVTLKERTVSYVSQSAAD